MITDFLTKSFNAEGCNFVWLGSEDENSLVSGSGRPFFVEIVTPKKRSGVNSKLLSSKGKSKKVAFSNRNDPNQECYCPRSESNGRTSIRD